MKGDVLFNRKFFSRFNSISFSIYLLHMPIICSLGFFLITRGGYSIGIVVTSVTLFLCFISVLFHYFVENKLTKLIISQIGKDCVKFSSQFRS